MSNLSKYFIRDIPFHIQSSVLSSKKFHHPKVEKNKIYHWFQTKFCVFLILLFNGLANVG